MPAHSLRVAQPSLRVALPSEQSNADVEAEESVCNEDLQTTMPTGAEQTNIEVTLQPCTLKGLTSKFLPN